MYVWEMVSCRLRMEGWEVWHRTRQDASGPTYCVTLHRPGITCEVVGPTLTEAYAAASRRAREQWGGAPSGVGVPHFGRASGLARVAPGT